MGEAKVKPRVMGMDEWKSGPDDLSPGCDITFIADIEEVGKVGLYFMAPGKQTNTFSMEATDDGTADEYYGPCHEFYYILVGEFTMYWGEDVSKIQEGTANKLLLKAGDMGYWTPGWKYSVKNTGKVPGTHFWGLTKPPQGTECRWAL
jgi:mannose-6-phosphate isomerase-like protein (cupin superfamily)